MSAVTTLAGRMTKPADLRFTKAGKAVVGFTVVTSRRVKDADGTWSDADTTFWDCKAFGQLAENIVESTDRGTAVIVQGRVVQESWEDKETGAKRSKFVVLVDEIGPSLRSATAAVTRSGGSGQVRSQFEQARRETGRAAADDPWGQQAPAGAGAGAGGWVASGGDEMPPF